MHREDALAARREGKKAPSQEEKGSSPLTRLAWTGRKGTVWGCGNGLVVFAASLHPQSLAQGLAHSENSTK